MGTEFWWFYDVMTVAIVVGIVYKCTRKGFMSSIAGFIGTAVSFIAALLISGSLAGTVYDNFVYEGIAEKINFTSESKTGTAEMAFLGLRNIDMSKALVSGKPLGELNLEPDDAGKVVRDLEVDLSNTGIDKAKLNFFGVDTSKTDFKDIKLKIEVKAHELEETDIGTIILAKTVSNQMLKTADKSHGQLKDMMEKVVPGYSKATEGSVDLVAKMLVAVIKDKDKSYDLKAVINENLVRPTLIVPIRALIFALAFALIEVVFSLIVKSLGLVSGIPVIGTVNTILGAALGIFEAAVALFVVSIGVGLLISLTGDNIIFLNTMTINNTKIFGYIYRMEFLNFKI